MGARVSVDDGIERAEGDPSIDDSVESEDDISTDDGKPEDDPSVDDSADDEDGASMPNAAVIAQGIANIVSDIVDSNYGTPPPTPVPTEKEDNTADDIVNNLWTPL